VGDLLGDGEKFDRLAGILFGLLDGLAAEDGVGFHDLPLLWRQFSRLEQDVVGDAYLADIMKRSRFGERNDGFVIEFGGVAGVLSQTQGQGAYVFLGPQQVVAGFRITGFGQTCQGVNGHPLDFLIFAHPARDLGFQVAVVVAQDVAGGLEFEVGADPCQDDRGADRFGDVVDGAEFEAVFLVGNAIHRRDEDHRDVACGGRCAEFGEDFVAIHFRHHHVEQDQVGWLATGNLQGSCPRIGGADPVIGLQQLAENREVFGGVIDHQDG